MNTVWRMVTQDGYTPLAYSCLVGNIATVQLLLAAGANRNKPDKKGFSPLHHAAAENHHEICQLLCDAGADQNRVDKVSLLLLHRSHGGTAAAMILVPTHINTHAPQSSHLVATSTPPLVRRACAGTRAAYSETRSGAPLFRGRLDRRTACQSR